MGEDNRYDVYREAVAGRANVEDTPELVAYYRSLEQFEAGALWTVANKIEPWEPKSESVPTLWRYRELRDHVLRSVALVTPEKAASDDSCLFCFSDLPVMKALGLYREEGLKKNGGRQAPAPI